MQSAVAKATRFRHSWTGWLAALLDVLIVAQLIALAASLLGGLDWGWLRMTSPVKPAFLLLLLIPARLAIPAQSPLFVAFGWLGARGRRLLPSVAWSRGLTPAWRDVLFALLITRLAALTVAFFVNLLFSPLRSRPFEMPFAWQKFAEIFAAWDSGWYFDIARRGYYYNPDGQSSIAFFPLYPMLMRAIAWPFGTTDRAVWVSGMLVSACALVFALVALHRLTERLLEDREAARRTVLYVAVFPFSFFFTRVYTESLFLLVSVLAVSAAYRSHWWGAGVWGGLAVLTRPNGLLIGIPLFLLALRDRPRVPDLVRRLLPLGLVPLALIGYCGYIYTLTGDPLAWLDAQRHWHYSLGQAPWRQPLTLLSTLERYGPYSMFFTSPLMPYQVIHAAIGLLFLALTPFVFKRLGLALGAYVLVSLLVPMGGSDPQGLGRYSAVLFPVFIALGSVGSPRLHEAILVVSSLFLALCVGLFVTWHPIF